MIIRTTGRGVNFQTPATLSRRLGLRPYEFREVLSAAEIRTAYRGGHQVLDVRVVISAWLDAATAPPKGGRR